jgi:hypothetical protein
VEKYLINSERFGHTMSDEVEQELERLKREKVVSEQTAALYLSDLRKVLDEESEARGNKEDK